MLDEMCLIGALGIYIFSETIFRTHQNWKW